MKTGLACAIAIILLQNTWLSSCRADISDFSFNEGLAIIKLNGLIGYIDQRGSVVIAPRFDSASIFNCGRAVAVRDEVYYVIDRSGEVVIDSKSLGINTIFPFKGGRSRVEDRSGRYGFIDVGGKIVIEARYTYACDFSQDMAYVEDGAKRLVVDISGKEVFEPPGRFENGFSEGLALFWNADETHFGFVDTVGIVQHKADLPDCRYHDTIPLRGFSQGVALFGNQGRRGLMSRAWKPVIDQRYAFVDELSEGLCVASVDGALFGFLNDRGEVVLPFRFAGAENFSEGLAAVRADDGLYYIDRSGSPVLRVYSDLPLNPVGLRSFKNGFAFVSRDRSGAYIRRDGSVLWASDELLFAIKAVVK